MTLRIAPGIDFSGLSEVGNVREENQDSIRLPDPSLPLERGLLCAVADGMGGLAYGKLASTLALDALFEEFYGADNSIPKSIGKGIESANARVISRARGLGTVRMGTTVTAVIIDGDRLHLGHVGDTRAYLIRGGRSECLTTDHTMVGEMVRMKVLSPDKVRTHAQRSVLNRAVGIDLFVRPEISEIQILDGDRIVLCSDGLWSSIEDDELGEVVSLCDDTEEASRKLVDLALKKGSDDNVSVIVLNIRQTSWSQRRQTGFLPGKLATMLDRFRMSGAAKHSDGTVFRAHIDQA
jgi:PPM family protein phosphatase